MKRLKMRTKITGGFLLLILLLLTISTVSAVFLGRASADFITYRGWATDSNLMSSVQETMLMVRMNVKEFLIRGEETDREQYASHYADIEKLMANAGSRIQNEKRARMVSEMDSLLGEYDTVFGEVVELQHGSDELLKQSLEPLGAEMVRDLTRILTSSREGGNTEAAYHASLSLRSLLLSRLHATKYVQTVSEENREQVENDMSAMNRYISGQTRRYSSALPSASFGAIWTSRSRIAIRAACICR